MGGGRPEGSRLAIPVPEVVWGPLAVGSLLLIVGLISLATGQPFLFPSLGPTAFLQAEKPDQPSSRFSNTVIGHLIGLGGGILAVLLLGAGSEPATLTSQSLTPIRCGAAVLAAILTMLGMALLKSPHPPAAATMLLVALGGFEPTWKSVAVILGGVLILAPLGEGVRYLRREVFPPPTGTVG